MFLPLGGDSEQEDWPKGPRIFLYIVGMLWVFMGVALISNVFMAAVEKITSRKVRVLNKATGKYVPNMVWNSTVANLTLMALGSSAPEILLSVIEIMSNDFFSGELGPSTIVGSAAFNLLMITAVCVVAIPAGESRRVKDLLVYAITASWSMFAYIWLVVILMLISPNIVEIWEGILTLLFFPMLVSHAFIADKGYLSRDREDADDVVTPTPVVSHDMTMDELAEATMRVRQDHGNDIPDDEMERILLSEYQKQPSRARHRATVVKTMSASRRTTSTLFAHQNANTTQSNPMFNVVPTLGAEDVPEEVCRHQPQATVEFACLRYTVLEGEGMASVRVRRVGKTVGSVSVEYCTRDGTATAGEDYKPCEGVLIFEPGDDELDIDVEIIDDHKFEPDENFFIDLCRPNSELDVVTLGNRTAEVIIIDDDDPGHLRFAKDDIVTDNPESHWLEIDVERLQGGSGKIGCSYRTEGDTAVTDFDFEKSTGFLEFEHGQMTARVHVKIKAAGRYEREELFRLILEEPSGGARFAEVVDGGPDKCICTIAIKPNQKERQRVEKVMDNLRSKWDQTLLGNKNWRGQFTEAIYVNGGPEGMDDADIKDWVVHLVLLPWKLIVACLPPPDFCGGWACFFAALVAIGLVTAVVSDIASLLGCLMEIPDSITAITFVALGTSLPDTFASMTAAVQDPTADASVGNVTGSNSVNVFLGLGLPWTLGSLYWQLMGATAEWSARYELEDFAQEFLSGALVVEADGLGFSVIVYSCCALLCLVLLYYRRIHCGGELGGSGKTKVATAIFLVLLWFGYIVLSVDNDLRRTS